MKQRSDIGDRGGGFILVFGRGEVNFGALLLMVEYRSHCEGNNISFKLN